MSSIQSVFIGRSVTSRGRWPGDGCGAGDLGGWPFRTSIRVSPCSIDRGDQGIHQQGRLWILGKFNNDLAKIEKRSLDVLDVISLMSMINYLMARMVGKRLPRWIFFWGLGPLPTWIFCSGLGDAMSFPDGCVTCWIHSCLLGGPASPQRPFAQLPRMLAGSVVQDAQGRYFDQHRTCGSGAWGRYAGDPEGSTRFLLPLRCCAQGHWAVQGCDPCDPCPCAVTV